MPHTLLVDSHYVIGDVFLGSIPNSKIFYSLSLPSVKTHRDTRHRKKLFLEKKLD